MANNFQNHNLPEKYASTILEIARWDMKVRGLVSKQFDGEMLHGVVKVPVRNAEVAVQEYDATTGVELTQSATTYVDIMADKDVAINEQIDGFVAQALTDNIKQTRLVSGAYALALSLEAKLINALTGTIGAGAEVNNTIINATNAYETLQAEIIKLKRKKLLVSDIKILVSPEVQGFLLLDERYTNTASTLGAEAVRSGVVGKLHGVDVVEIPYLPTGIQYIAFANNYVFAGEVFSVAPNFNDLTNKFIGSSALQGRVKPYQAVLKPEFVHIGKGVGDETMDEGITPATPAAAKSKTVTE